MAEPKEQFEVKARSEWLLYVLLFFSNGLFAFIWIVMLMYDINRLERRSVFPIKILAAVFFVIFSLYFAFLFVPESLATIIPATSTTRVVALFVLAPTLIALLTTILVLVYRRAKIDLGGPFETKDVFATIGLTFLLMLSFVLVQQRVNTLIGKRAQVI